MILLLVSISGIWSVFVSKISLFLGISSEVRSQMYNWSVDEKYLAQFPEKYKLWKLEQLLSYGLEGQKLEKTEITKNWPYLKKRLDPKRREFLEYILWDKLS